MSFWRVSIFLICMQFFVVPPHRNGRIRVTQNNQYCIDIARADKQTVLQLGDTRSSGGSRRRKSDRGFIFQAWGWWVRLAWLAGKFDLCNDAVKQNPVTSIFRQLWSLKAMEHEATILQRAPSH